MAARSRRALLAATVLVAAACGGGDDDTESSNTTAATSAPSTMARAEELRIVPEALVDTKVLIGTLHGVQFAAGSVWVSSHRADTVLRIDPATLEVIAEVPTGRLPAVIRGNDDGVWVANYGSTAAESDIVRIDPATNTVVARVNPADICCEMALSGDSLWTVSIDGELSRVDVATNQLDTTTVDLGVELELGTMSADESGVWVSTPGAIVRVDRASNAVTDEVEVPGILAGVVDGTVWGVGTHEIWALDPATGEVVSTELPDTIAELGPDAVIDGDTMFASASLGERGWKWIVALDLATGAVTGAVETGFSPERIAVGGGFVWSTDDNGTLAKVDAGALAGS